MVTTLVVSTARSNFFVCSSDTCNSRPISALPIPAAETEAVTLMSIPCFFNFSCFFFEISCSFVNLEY